MLRQELCAIIDQSRVPTPKSGQVIRFIDRATMKLCTKDSTGTVTEYGEGGGGGIDVADGTYTMGLGVTTNGTITIIGGQITAITQAT